MVCGKIFQRLWYHEDVTLKSLVPILILVVVSVIFSAVLMGIENASGSCGVTFWEMLYLINTVHTTIGYGNVSPCSAGAKVGMVIYFLIGIPLTIWVLDVVGKILAAVVNAIWTESYCFCCCFVKKKKLNAIQAPDSASSTGKNGTKKKNRVKSSDDKRSLKSNWTDDLDPEKPDSKDDVPYISEEKLLPVLIAVPMIILWILISALFFWGTEDQWYYLDSVYFVFISIFTIGFGDIGPIKYKLVFFQFFFIFLGLALFSLVLNLITLYLQRLQDELKKKIQQQYAEKIAQGGMDQSPEAKKEFLKNEAGWKRFLLGDRAIESIENDFAEAASHNSQETQTPRVEYADAESFVNLAMFKFSHENPKFKLIPKSDFTEYRKREEEDYEKVTEMLFPFVGYGTTKNVKEIKNPVQIKRINKTPRGPRK